MTTCLAPAARAAITQQSPRLPARTRLAGAAAVARAHGDTVALDHAPARLRVSTQLFDDAERLVARDHRIGRVVPVLGLGAFVLLVVAAADAARLDAQQRV